MVSYTFVGVDGLGTNQLDVIAYQLVKHFQYNEVDKVWSTYILVLPLVLSVFWLTALFFTKLLRNVLQSMILHKSKYHFVPYLFPSWHASIYMFLYVSKLFNHFYSCRSCETYFWHDCNRVMSCFTLGRVLCSTGHFTDSSWMRKDSFQWLQLIYYVMLKVVRVLSGKASKQKPRQKNSMFRGSVAAF